MNNNSPNLLSGDIHSDERGDLIFNNNFDLSDVKRMYTIRHTDTSVVRAWQGHQKEHKYFMCIKGSFVVAWKRIDSSNNPINDAVAEFVILKAGEGNILSIPAGHANGLKALLPDSKIMVFSNHILNDSLVDDIRFDKNLWLDWNQF